MFLMHFRFSLADIVNVEIQCPLRGNFYYFDVAVLFSWCTRPSIMVRRKGMWAVSTEDARCEENASDREIV